MIRLANKGDLDDINKLLFQVHKVHSDARPDLFKAGAKKYNDKELLEIINDEKRPIFVCVDNGVIIGYAFCIFKDNKNIHSLCDYTSIYIDDLCVDEKYRGKGIGKDLYEFVVDFARKSGCYNVTLNVWADNKNAVKFYEKLGMRIQKIGMEVILEENE